MEASACPLLLLLRGTGCPNHHRPRRWSQRGFHHAAKEVINGEGTLIGADSLITDIDFHVPIGNHRWGNDLLASAALVRIGKGYFIGARAIILKGITIDEGAVIAAGAIVTRDVPPRHLAAGNPATLRPLGNRWLQPDHNPY